MDGKTRSEILALGAFMGAAHVVSPDHLSALATLSAGLGPQACGLGVRWGLGHSLGMVGAAALLLLATWGVEHAAERRAEGLAWSDRRRRNLSISARFGCVALVPAMEHRRSRSRAGASSLSFPRWSIVALFPALEHRARTRAGTVTPSSAWS